MDGFLRHIRACRNARIPGGRLALRVGGVGVGWVDPRNVEALLRHGAVREGEALACTPDRLDALARGLAGEGLFRWRGELFDVTPGHAAPVVGTIDRGALPVLGIAASGVHLNALVQRADGLWMWASRRSPTKLLDPAKLDNLVGGGVASGQSGDEALAREAAEEAGLSEELIRRASLTARIDYAMDRPEGLRRDTLLCYDVVLPASFSPVAVDGEVAGFELMTLADAAARVAGTDDFKFNVNLVLIDLLLRHQVIPSREDGVDLRAALDAS